MGDSSKEQQVGDRPKRRARIESKQVYKAQDMFEIESLLMIAFARFYVSVFGLIEAKNVWIVTSALQFLNSTSAMLVWYFFGDPGVRREFI